MTSQGQAAIAIGINAGKVDQSANAIAIGESAGLGASGGLNQGSNAIAIGTRAGEEDQFDNAIAIGFEAGNVAQGTGDPSGGAIAIGYKAGSTSQARGAIALGTLAGSASQGQNTIAIGEAAGTATQNRYAVAIGHNAGAVSQGRHAVALGYQAGQSNQFDQSIVINATNGALNSGAPLTCYVKPIRDSSSTDVLYYNPVTSEIIHNPIPSAWTVNTQSVHVTFGVKWFQRLADSGNVARTWYLVPGSTPESAMDIWNPATAYLNRLHQPGAALGQNNFTTPPSWSCPYKTIIFTRFSVHFSSGTIAALSQPGWGGPAISLFFQGYCNLLETGLPNTLEPGGFSYEEGGIKSGEPCVCRDFLQTPRLICASSTQPGAGALSVFLQMPIPATPGTPNLPAGDYNISVSLFGTGILA